MKTKHHVSLSIEGALRSWRSKDYLSAFPDEPNWRISKKRLELEAFKGRKVLPFGEPCEGFSYETGCPGHPIEETV